MGITDFLASPSGKRMTGIAYGFGASIVIIGALFKIQHYPGAGVMLMIGMGIEAILFALSALEKPHKEWEWSRVYPELEDEESEPVERAKVKGGKGNPAANALGKFGEEEIKTINPEMVEKINANISKLAQSSGDIASIANAASVSDSYVNNLSKASQAAGAFADSQKKLTDSSDSLVSSYKNIETSISSASQGSRSFADQIDGINKNISTINSVFELQVESVNKQNEAMKSLSAAVAKIESSLNGSSQEAESYKDQIALLAKQMKSLNSVYGNMLNAMTIRG